MAGAQTAGLAQTCGLQLDITQIHVTRFTFHMTDPDAIVPCWFDEFEDVDTWGLTVRPGYWGMGIHWAGEPVDLSFERSHTTAAVLAKAQQYIERRANRLHPDPVDVIECNGDDGGDGIYFARRGPITTLWGDNLFKFAPVIGTALAEAALEGGSPNLPLHNASPGGE